MNKAYLLVILLIAILLPLNSQTFEERQKQIEEQFNAYKQKQEREYQAFYDRMNAQYADYLKRSWQKREMVKGVEKPKDETVPPVKYEGEENIEHKQKAVVIEKSVVEPAPQPVIPEPVKPTIYRIQSFSFYGTQLECRYPDNKEIHISDINPENIAAAWNIMSDESYYVMIHDCLQIRDSLKLCDWAFLGMLDSLAQGIYGRGNDATFVQAYLFSKSGYAMRFGNLNNRLIMLVGCKHIISDASYIPMDGMNFYALGEDIYRVEISDAKFDGEKAIELSISDNQNLMFNPTEKREIKSELGVAVKCSVNHNLIDFFNAYPTPLVEFGNGYAIDWKLYAYTPLDKNVSEELYSQLRNAIQGKDNLGAVNILLNWVQTSFEYQYDDSVWGHDRAFFPSETLYYPYCDCEDRSILFTRLVRDLLHLDVALVYYPGHLATAVKFNEQVNGDFIMADGQRYIICDPTYIGAPVGLSMRMVRADLAQLFKL